MMAALPPLKYTSSCLGIIGYHIGKFPSVFHIFFKCNGCKNICICLRRVKKIAEEKYNFFVKYCTHGNDRATCELLPRSDTSETASDSTY